MDDEMKAFEKWWMDWHWTHRKPQRKDDFTLGQAVVAAWNAGKEFAQARLVDEDAGMKEHP